MKQDLVLREAFSIIFNKIIQYMNVSQVHLVLLLIIKYPHGNQQVFLVILMIVI